MGVFSKLLLGGLLASVVAASLPGCQEEAAFGFVQIKSEITLAANDVYKLNGQPVEGLRTGTDLVLKQKAGQNRLVLLRNGREWPLCAFDLAKNRVVTATLTPVRGTIKCVVRG